MSSVVDEGPSLRPCCDFATLALGGRERRCSARDNGVLVLRAQIGSESPRAVAAFFAY